MSFFVCMVPVCSMRAAASHRAEQVSQLLFGEVVQHLETSGDFVLVKHLYDEYEGWCQRAQLAEIAASQFEGMPEKFAAGYVNQVLVNNVPMQVPMGSLVGNIPQQGVRWQYFDVQYKGENIAPQKNSKAEVIEKMARKYLNTAYQWGGRSVFGVDCSGFTQMVYRLAGIPLLRDAWQQAGQGYAIGFLQEAGCGDLAFFDNAEGRITHVGILLNAATIIHAAGKVRIDSIDHQGIVNADTGIRTHQLRVIKRLL